eukprot:405984-Prymnesium_polylepis.1
MWHTRRIGGVQAGGPAAALTDGGVRLVLGAAHVAAVLPSLVQTRQRGAAAGAPWRSLLLDESAHAACIAGGWLLLLLPPPLAGGTANGARLCAIRLDGTPTPAQTVEVAFAGGDSKAAAEGARAPPTPTPSTLAPSTLAPSTL